MSATAALLVLVVTWVAIGVITAVVMGRRGHAPYSWALLGAVLGPLVVPLMISAARREQDAAPSLARSTSSSATRAATSSGALDLLVGVDGSEDATGALVTAIALFGPHIGRLTVATVLDYDGGPTNVPLGEQDRAAAILERDALLAAGLLDREPERATLTGRPADALVQFAVQTRLRHGCHRATRKGRVAGALRQCCVAPRARRRRARRDPAAGSPELARRCSVGLRRDATPVTR